MTELKIGDRIKDNDPRMCGRELRVFDILGDMVRAEGFGGRVAVLSRSRIFTDGKPRKSGFSLVDSAERKASKAG